MQPEPNCLLNVCYYASLYRRSIDNERALCIGFVQHTCDENSRVASHGVLSDQDIDTQDQDHDQDTNPQEEDQDVNHQDQYQDLDIAKTVLRCLSVLRLNITVIIKDFISY